MYLYINNPHRNWTLNELITYKTICYCLYHTHNSTSNLMFPWSEKLCTCGIALTCVSRWVTFYIPIQGQMWNPIVNKSCNTDVFHLQVIAKMAKQLASNCIAINLYAFSLCVFSKHVNLKHTHLNWTPWIDRGN